MQKRSHGSRQKTDRSRGRQADSASLHAVQDIIGPGPYSRPLLIEYLHLLQDHQGYLDMAQLTALSSLMKLSSVEVFEVASFYHHFHIVHDRDTPPPPLTVRVCDSISCAMAGAEQLIEELEQFACSTLFRLQRVPCVGRCDAAPVAVVAGQPVTEATRERVEWTLESGHKMGLPDYVDYATYLSSGGYSEFRRLCSSNPETAREEIITRLEDARLRGMGGAGFPAGRKWRIVNEFQAPRYLAVNIDEGEPGTFKDRFFLESNPHQFLEGMLIAAWVIDAAAIYIYLRDEYTAGRRLLTLELQRLQEAPPCRLPEIHLRRGAGAYICGEESAMIESIEGKRGMPRQRPPYIAERGLFGRPTLEHNMETLHWIPEILSKGGDWFASQGRHERSGLRSFSVSGRVRFPGVHIAPAGITLRELIDEYCGGMAEGHRLKAYLPGGASGGILPTSLDHLPLDFDTLNEYGCFIGSAAIIILSQQDSVRAVATNAMRFFAHESCGQCTPCRVGTAKAAELMCAEHWDQALLEELAMALSDASICGLGQAAPNPLRCAMKYFPEEFEQ